MIGTNCCFIFLILSKTLAFDWERRSKSTLDEALFSFSKRHTFILKRSSSQVHSASILMRYKNWTRSQTKQRCSHVILRQSHLLSREEQKFTTTPHCFEFNSSAIHPRFVPHDLRLQVHIFFHLKNIERGNFDNSKVKTYALWMWLLLKQHYNYQKENFRQ